MHNLSRADMHVYEYDWAPDSGAIVYTAAPGEGENNYWLARLFTVGLAEGQRDTKIYKPEAQIAAPRWSPDRKTIAFIQGIMSDQGLTGGDIWSVPAEGGPARNLTPGRPSSPSSLWWLHNPDRLLFLEWSNGGVSIARS